MFDLSTENNPDEIPINVVSTNESNIDLEEPEYSQINFKELTKLLELEKQKVSESEEKLKHVLADFQNLSKKTQSDIEIGIDRKINEFILDFLKIYDDFIRAKDVFAENKISIDGLDSILKNMNSLLIKYNVTPIEALGEIFNPNFHEAISIISDPDLDDDTITKEIRKGYISQNTVVRPTLVEISKKDDKI